MEIRDFGSTGLRVSVLGFGASHIGADSVSEEEAGRALNAVLDLGVTLIDTARGYGKSEERIGRHLAHRRGDFVLSSKCGYGVDGVADWTPECITRGIDRALATMQTDRIDIMHFHSCPLATLRSEDLVAALLRAVEQGKVRVAAYSGEDATGPRDPTPHDGHRESPRHHAIESGKFGSIQTSINICDQRVIQDALPHCAGRGLGVIAKRPIANAFWRFAERPVGDYALPYWDRARAMNLAPPAGIPWPELALRFTAFTPHVHACIVGTANMDHFRQNLALLEKGPLPADVYTSIREAFRENDDGWVGQV